MYACNTLQAPEEHVVAALLDEEGVKSEQGPRLFTKLEEFHEALEQQHESDSFKCMLAKYKDPWEALSWDEPPEMAETV